MADVPRTVPVNFPRALQRPRGRTNVGLGFGIDDPVTRRPSSGGNSDESLPEITTPVMHSEGVRDASSYHGFVDPSAIGSTPLRGQMPEQARLLASYREPRSFSPARSLSPGSRSGSDLDQPHDHVLDMKPAQGTFLHVKYVE